MLQDLILTSNDAYILTLNDRGHQPG